MTCLGVYVFMCVSIYPAVESTSYKFVQSVLICVCFMLRLILNTLVYSEATEKFLLA